MRTGQEADFTTVSRQLTTTLYTEANLIPVPTPKKQGDLLVFPSKICVSMFFPLSTDPSGGRGSRRAENPQTTPTHTLGRARLLPSRSPLSVFSSRGSPTTVARSFLPGCTLPKTKPRSGARFPVDQPFRGLITTQQKGTVAWASARVITHETKRSPGATVSFCSARVCDSGLKGRFPKAQGAALGPGHPPNWFRGLKGRFQDVCCFRGRVRLSQVLTHLALLKPALQACGGV